MMITADNPILDAIYEMYKQWCRLKGYHLPETNAAQWFDEASGIQDQRMQEFSVWFKEEVLTRLPKS